MTLQEFSDEFDVLYNNIMSNQAPGLDEYEKSVFLTKALDEILKSYFDPKLNKPQEGFDGVERRQIDFSQVVKTVTEYAISNAEDLGIHPGSNIQYFILPTDILLYINEQVIVTRDSSKQNLVVIPLAYTEFSRLMSKAYKRPLKHQAWRVIVNGKTTRKNAVTHVYDALSLMSILDKIAELGGTLYTAISSNKTSLASYLQEMSGSNLISLERTGEDTYIFKAGSNLYFTVNGTLIGSTSKSLNATLTKDLIEEFNTLCNSIFTTTSVVSADVAIIPGPNDTISSYKIRYIKRPNPIILSALENVTVGGYVGANSSGTPVTTGATKGIECELDPILHHEILQRAVELAKAAYTGDLSSHIALGQSSETNMGIVAQSRQ